MKLCKILEYLTAVDIFRDQFRREKELLEPFKIRADDMPLPTDTDLATATKIYFERVKTSGRLLVRWSGLDLILKVTKPPKIKLINRVVFGEGRGYTLIEEVNGLRGVTISTCNSLERKKDLRLKASIQEENGERYIDIRPINGSSSVSVENLPEDIKNEYFAGNYIDFTYRGTEFRIHTFAEDRIPSSQWR